MEETKHLIVGPISSAFVAEQLDNHAGKTTIGAHAFFLGQVRADEIEGKTVEAIEYSAYAEMIEITVKSIKDELFLNYPDLICLHIWHSTGVVRAGENSLLVLVSSGHRQVALRALEECIERIKEKLPVWKKEFFTDGSSRWIH